MAAILFRRERIAPADYTVPGVGIRRRRPLRHRRPDLLCQLLEGPFLAAFDAGIYDFEVRPC